MISSDKKQAIIKDLQTNKNDTGSTEVQIGILSERIDELTQHLKVNKKDFMARRGLLQMVGKRKRLLRYLARQDSNKYLELTEKLKIRR